MSNVRKKAPKGFFSIDPIRGIAQARGEGTSTMLLPPLWEGEGPRLIVINPRTVNNKRKAKDRANRKRIKRQKAIQRRAGH